MVILKKNKNQKHNMDNQKHNMSRSSYLFDHK